MKRFNEQQKSKTFQHGEPKSHLNAKFTVSLHLHHAGYETYFEYPLKILKQYYHQYDIAAFRLNEYIEVENETRVPGDGIAMTNEMNRYQLRYLFSTYKKPEQLVNYRFKNLIDKKVLLIVEVDDPNLHSSKLKRINDGIAKEQALANFPNVKFIRLNKFEINGKPADRLEYFTKYLDPYL
jgi:hypothetical protein